jgi:hypothetical protein
MVRGNATFQRIDRVEFQGNAGGNVHDVQTAAMKDLCRQRFSYLRFKSAWQSRNVRGVTAARAPITNPQPGRMASITIPLYLSVAKIPSSPWDADADKIGCKPANAMSPLRTFEKGVWVTTRFAASECSGGVVIGGTNQSRCPNYSTTRNAAQQLIELDRRTTTGTNNLKLRLLLDAPNCTNCADHSQVSTGNRVRIQQWTHVHHECVRLKQGHKFK